MSSAHFKRSALAIFISFCCSSPLSYASFVRGDIDYQYFRDLAENKGKFFVGARNVEIHDTNGKHIGTIANGRYVPDFAPVDRIKGTATLVAPQYVFSVAHNRRVMDSVEFGAQGKNPDAHPFRYYFVNFNDYPEGQQLDDDYQHPRLNKVVTEVAPAEMSTAGVDSRVYLDKNRFPDFLRVGSGKQWTRAQEYLSDAYIYLTAGNPLALHNGSYGFIKANSSVYDTTYGPMASYASPGDSGSPLFGYDKQVNRWVVVGSAVHYTGDKGETNGYALPRVDFLNQIQQQNTAAHLTNNITNGIYRWLADTNKPYESRLTSPSNTVHNVNLVNFTLNDKEQLDHGKNLYFTGNKGVLELGGNINQGAGSLIFNTDFTVRGKTGTEYWLGGGVSIANNKVLDWQVRNPQGDRLSKVGQGTLIVNGRGENPGDISIGEGKVILQQQADAQGKQQAFNEIGIVSGRPTVVINGQNQFDPNKLYFGFRGGRLDLNGHSLTFNRIQNADEGARIVNHHRQATSVLNIDGINVSENDIEWQSWSKPAKNNLTIYEYVNTHRGNRKDYFRLLRSPSSYFPTNGTSSVNWEFLGSDKAAAIEKVLSEYRRYTAFSGYLGETDSSKPNGRLDVNFRPSNEQLLLMTGGMKLNGTFNISNGRVVMSGRPTPHARNEIIGQDVVKEDDWQDRQFQASQINVSNNAKFYLGRNVSRFDGAIKASNNALISLGVVQGRMPYCIRSDHSGLVDCQENHNLASNIFFNNIPTNEVYGHITLNDKSHLDLGKVHLHGKIFAYNQGNASQTKVVMHDQSKWTMPGSSYLNHLEMLSGSEINLHPNYHNLSSQQLQNGEGRFNNLIINGDLSGTGRFNILTNAAAGKGDLLTVKGLATGTFTLGVKNTGAEPQSASPLALVRLLSPLQKVGLATFRLAQNYVDLGAYRYVLAYRNNEYRLYSPVKEVLQQSGSQDPAARQQAVENAKQIANQQMAEMKRLSQEMEQKEREKANAERQANDLAAKAQAERQRGEEAKRRASRYLLRHRREAALNAANDILRKAEQQQNEANRYRSTATQYTNDINRVKQSLAQAKALAIEAEKKALALQNSNLSTLSEAEFNSRMKQLCQSNQVEAALCHSLISTSGRSVNDQDNQEKLQRIEQLTQDIQQKERERTDYLAKADQQDKQAAKASADAENHRRRAARYLLQTRKQNALNEANRADQTAYAARQEADRLRRLASLRNDELDVLKQTLSVLQQTRTRELISTLEQEQNLTQAMAKVEQLEQDYQEASTALEEAKASFNALRATLSAEDIAREEGLLALAEKKLAELKAQLDTAETEEAEAFLALRLQRKLSAQEQQVFGRYRQADLISQFANAALSDLSAQANNLLQIGQGIDRQLLNDNPQSFNVWSSQTHYHQQHQSVLFRRYQQRADLTQLGLEAAATDALRFGAVLSYNRSQNQFDDGVNGKSRLTMFTGYAKYRFANGSAISLDLGIGQAKNHIASGEFRRKLYQAGLTASHQWQWQGVQLQPSAGLRYHRIAGVNYEMEQANIQIPNTDFMSYQLGLKVAKTFELGSVQLRPSLESKWIHANQQTAKMWVNRHLLEQQFGRYWQHEVGLSANIDQWQINAHLGTLNGSQTAPQRYVSLKVGYSW